MEGYYNSLLSFLDKAVDEGFISPIARRIIVSAPTAKQLVRELEVRRLVPFHFTRAMLCYTSDDVCVFYFFQEHIPECDEIISKLNWDDVESLNYMPESD